MSSDAIAYVCDCGLWIDAESYDPQAAPLITCPVCLDEMELVWERGKPRRVDTLPLVRDRLDEQQREPWIVPIVDEGGTNGRGRTDLSVHLAQRWSGLRERQVGTGKVDRTLRAIDSAPRGSTIVLDERRGAPRDGISAFVRLLAQAVTDSEEES